MPESYVNQSEGSGKKAHTFQRTIGANTVEDQVVIAGHAYEATYSVPFFGSSTATASSHVIQLLAGASLNVYVWRLTLWQSVAATTAAFEQWVVKRITTAGTGGTSVTPNPWDLTDAAAGATAMQLPTSKGTEAANLWGHEGYLTQTPGAAGVSMLPVFDFQASGLYKPWRISAGTSNGIVVKNNTAIAGAQVSGVIVFTEANF